MKSIPSNICIYLFSQIQTKTVPHSKNFSEKNNFYDHTNPGIRKTVYAVLSLREGCREPGCCRVSVAAIDEQFSNGKLIKRSHGKPKQPLNAEYIRALKAQGLDRKTLSEKLGLARSTVQKYWNT